MGMMGCSAAPPAPASQADPNKSEVATTRAPSPSQARLTPIDLVPGRLRNAYQSKSDRGVVNYARTEAGWTISLVAPPSADPNRGEWAGFCWDIAPVDGTAFGKLRIDLAQVDKGAEVEVKLERQSNDIQEAKLEFLKQGTLRIDLTTFQRVRAEVARLCIMAIGQPTAKAPTETTFVFTGASLEP